MTAELPASGAQTGESGRGGAPEPRSIASVAAAAWRCVLFGGMAALCLYVSALHFVHPAANPWYVGPLYVAGALAAWYSPVWAVFGFVVAVPLLNGLTITMSESGGNPLNVVFSGIYLAWLFRRVFVRRQSLAPPTRVAWLIDVLATTALCSLLITLLGYPRSEVFPAAFGGVVLDQHLLLYGIHAAAVFTQGLFLYRLLELEADTVRGHRPFARALLVITTIVIAFSLLQFVFDVPAWRWLNVVGKRGLFSPLDDIHSAGSVAVMLFSVALFTAYGEHGRARLVNGTAAILLAWCAVYSLSRAAWVALLVVVMVFVWQLGRRAALVATTGILVVVVLAFSLIQIRDFSVPSVPYPTKALSSPASLTYRFYRWGVTMAMIRDVPMSGVGIGSYLRLFPSYSNYDPARDGAEHFAIRAPENAHNYFLQLAAELGLPALAVFLALLVYVFRRARRRLATEPGATCFLKGLAVGIGAYLLSCLTGHPLLLPAQQFVFWFAVAALMIAPTCGQDPPSRRHGRFAPAALAVLCVAMAAGHAYRAYALSDSTGYRYGLYPAEERDTDTIEWTRKDARWQLEATSDVIGLTVIADPHNIGANGLGLTIGVNGRELDKRTIFTAGTHEFSYYVPGIAHRSISIQLSVTSTFNPRRLGLSQDDRDLGVALAPVTFLPDLPPDGVGFYQWETLEASGVPLATQETTLPFRWTQRQATVPFRGRPPGAALIVLLRATHPDIRTRPVSVELLGDGRVLRMVTLNDPTWRRLEIPAETLRGVQALTLRADRTWNPRLAGVSADARDLGIGVILR